MDEEDRAQMLAAQQAGHFQGMDPQQMAALMQNCANPAAVAAMHAQAQAAQAQALSIRENQMAAAGMR